MSEVNKFIADSKNIEHGKFCELVKEWWISVDPEWRSTLITTLGGYPMTNDTFYIHPKKGLKLGFEISPAEHLVFLHGIIGNSGEIK